MSFMDSGDPAERLKRALISALSGGSATGVLDSPEEQPAHIPSSDPGMSFPAPKAALPQPANPPSSTFTLPPVDTSRLDDLRAKSAAIPDTGIARPTDLKGHLLKILSIGAPIAAGALFGGSRGAATAAGMENENIQNTQKTNLARKAQLDSQAQAEEQMVQHQREFGIGQQERQREFDQRQQELQSLRDFQQEMARGKAPTTVDTGEGVKQWNPQTKQWEVMAPSKSSTITPQQQRQFDLEEERIQAQLRGQNMTDARMREQNQISRDTKAEQQRSQQENQVSSLEDDLDRMAEAAKELRDHPGLSRITGAYGRLPSWPGGDAANAAAKLDTLKSQIGFGVLQKMRSQSKTGGALGQISDEEEKLLQDNLAALDRAQSPEEFRKSLDKIIAYADDTKKKARSGITPQGGKQFSIPGKVRKYNPATDTIE